MTMISPFDRGESPPESIKLEGFGCGLRGGCEQPDRCNAFGGCIVFENPTPRTLERVTAARREPPVAKLNPLDEIALLIRALTYGEMIEFGQALWAVKPDADLDRETLAPTFHKWSMSRDSQ